MDSIRSPGLTTGRERERGRKVERESVKEEGGVKNHTTWWVSALTTVVRASVFLVLLLLMLIRSVTVRESLSVNDNIK